jgi:hypothetical protein
MSGTRKKTSATASTPLRAFLAARVALAALAATAPSALATLDDTLLAEAARAVTGLDLPREKLALLRASLADFDIAAAARRFTPTQAQAALAPTGAARRALPAPVGALTVETLETMTPDAWAEFVRWLLEQEGASVDPRPFAAEDGWTAWRGERDGARLIICAWRAEPGWPLLEDDLRLIAPFAASSPGARLVIVTTAEATVGARLSGQMLGEARFLDRGALATALAGLTTAYQREQEHVQDIAKARAKAATSARKKLLTALTALDEAARATPRAQKVTGRPAVRKVATQVEQARRLAAQALMAWETLLTEWSVAFGERPARDGSLTLSAEPSAYTELAERADHLKKPSLDALKSLAKTPSDGDLGYAAWRVAVGEELAARCAALRWRAQLVDPAHWQDFAAAINDLALQEATRAENAATHAAARAERAYSQLVERVGAL